MGVDLYQYECDECETTVVTKHHPQQDENEPLLCPGCSAVEVDYTVDPDEFENPNITHL